MESSETALKYPKMTGFATTHGLEFEWTLAALLHLRGLNSDCNFLLGTNVEGAGAMDDIVFCLEHDGVWRTTYVQLKHKERKWLSRSMLTKPDEAFSLSKYFKSYLEIKKAMSTEPRETLFKGKLEDCLFVLFTNATGNKDLGEKCSDDFSQAEEILWSGSGSVFSLDKDEDMLTCLGDCGQDGRQFLKQLRVFCGQLSGEKLKAAVKDELREMEKYKIKDLHIDRLCECYLGHVKAWWEKRETKNDILHRGHNILEEAIERVSRESEIIEDKTRLLTTSEQTLKEFGLGLVFEVTALNELTNGLSTVSHVVSSEGSGRLSLTKLWQASEGPSLMIKIEHLIPYKRALLAECLHGNVKRLVVFADKDWPEDLSELYFEIVNEIVKGKNKCSVVFLSDENNSQVSALTARFPGGGGSHADNFLFSQIQEVSRNEILGLPVKLQGHDTYLGELLTKDCNLLDQVLDASLIVEILGREGLLEVGSAMPEGIEYYVGRTLEQAHFVKASALKALHGTVCIRISQSETSARGLLEKALEFLSSLKDSPSFNHKYNLRHTINKVVQNPAGTDSQGFIGSKTSFFNPGDMKDTINNLDPSRFDRDLIDYQLFIESNLPSSRNDDVGDIMNIFVPDKNDSQVFNGTKFSLGLFECNFVGLRFGQDNAVTALRVCSSKEAVQQVSFLFVDMETNEEDVNKLTEFHDVRHLLDFKDGHLRWIRSHGGIESIQKHIDEDQVSSFTPETAVDVEDRLVLVCAEPGMGKTTLMARLAKNTKEALPDCLVILIALNDHTKLFAQGKHKDALEFLSIAAKMESPLQRSLLKFALEVSGNVVVIADGFDEIAPRYVKECCHLLSRLLEETKAMKIWMTSRNSVKQTIETHFSKFSAKLHAFDEEAQKIFFKSFWNKKSKLGASELDKFIDDLLEKSSKTIKEKEKTLLGIPLQCQMLAEVFEDCVNGSVQNSKLPEKLDLLSLLEMFVVKKCKVYVENSLKISCDSTNYDDLLQDAKKKFVDSHSKAGLVLILGEDELKTLGLEQVIKEWSAFCKEIQLGKDKTGFVDVIVDDKPRFIHRVFAEYFVAKWISQHLADSAELIKSKMFTEDFAVIRHIFNGVLCKDFVLHTAVLQENEAEVRTLLESEDVEAQDVGGRTALHLAAGLGTSEDREENTRRGEILDPIIGKSSDFKVVDKILFGSPLRYADMTRTWVAIDKLLCKTEDNGDLGLTLGNVGDENMLDTVFQQDLDKLLGLCLDNGLEVEHRSRGTRLLVRACQEGSFKVTSLLIERNADINQIEDESVSGNKDKGTVEFNGIKVDGEEDKEKNKEAGKNNKNEVKGNVSPLIAASSQGHIEIVKLLLQICVSKISLSHANLENYLDPSQYINMKSWDGTTAVHHAAREGHDDVIRFLLGQGGDPQSRDRDNNTPLHLAGWYNRPKVVRVLMQAWDESDRAEREGMTLQEYINLKDKDRDTAIHLAALGGSVECVKILVQAGGNISEKGIHRRTPLMIAAMEGKQEVVEWLLDNINAEREGMTLQEYIDLKDEYGNTTIHLAALGGSVECVKLLVQAGGNISEKNFNRRTPLIIATLEGKQEVVEWLLGNFNAEREGITLQEYIDLKGENGNTAIHFAALGGSVECVKLLVQAGGNISEKNFNGQTPLIIAAMKGKQEVVEWLLDNFNAKREGMKLQEYIDLKDEDGDTAIHHAAWRGSVECVKLLVQAGGKISEKNFIGLTPLMIATMIGKQEVVEWLLDNFYVETEGMTLQEYIDLKHKDGNTAIHLAALGGSVECVKLLVQAGGNISEKDFNGQTPLMIEAMEGKQEVVEWLLDNFNAEREGMTLQEYIDLKDKDGDSAIHLVFSGGSVECVKILVQAGGNISEKGYIGQTPLMIAAKEGKLEVVEWLLDNFNAEREGMTLLEYIDLKEENGNTAIHLAALGGFVECVKLLVQAGGNISEKGFNGRTPLMIATMEGKQEVVEWLLDNFKAERDGMTLQEYIDLKDNNGNTAIHLAAWGGSGKCVKILVQSGKNISEKGFNGRTPLMIATMEGKQEVVEWLLDNFNAEREGMTLQEYIDLKDKDGNTAIHFAAWGGSVECVKLLVQSGGNISEKGFNGQTPLIKAAMKGKQEVVEWLLDNFHAEREGMTLQEYIDLKDKEGNTAIHLAALGGSVECVKLLVQAGGNISENDFNGQTPLMTAAREGKQEVVEWLLEISNTEREAMTVHKYIDIKDKFGDTALHFAAYGGFAISFTPLLQAGGKLSEVGWNGQTPLMTAAMEGRQEVLKAILDNFNAEREGITFQEYIDKKDKDGDTVVHLAAVGCSVDFMKHLVKAGGKLSVVDSNGQTPLMLAAWEGRQGMVKWLLDNFNEKAECITVFDYIHIQDKDSDTVLHFAALKGSLESIKLLYSTGMKLSQVGWNGESLLMVSASSERLNVVEWLLDNFDAGREGMSVQEFIGLKCENGDTVMHLAAWGCSLGFLNCLVNAGGKLSEVGLNGETPLMTAAREGRQEVVKWLLDNFNAEREGMTLQEYIDLKDKDGNTVIHYAGLKCSVVLVKLLLEAAGRLPQLDSYGRKPLMIAALEGKQEVVEWLLDNFNAEREGMTLQEYIDLKDKEGRTVLFWAGSKTREAIENICLEYLN